MKVIRKILFLATSLLAVAILVFAEFRWGLVLGRRFVGVELLDAQGRQISTIQSTTRDPERILRRDWMATIDVGNPHLDIVDGCLVVRINHSGTPPYRILVWPAGVELSAQADGILVKVGRFTRTWRYGELIASAKTFVDLPAAASVSPPACKRLGNVGYILQD
jgi:hypothetical protein